MLQRKACHTQVRSHLFSYFIENCGQVGVFHTFLQTSTSKSPTLLRLYPTRRIFIQHYKM
jgi:hypothetical protein